MNPMISLAALLIYDQTFCVCIRFLLLDGQETGVNSILALRSDMTSGNLGL